MEFDYNPVIFIIAIAVGIIFISLAILFGFKIAYGFDYDECLQTYNSTLVCDMFIPPINIQGA